MVETSPTRHCSSQLFFFVVTVSTCFYRPGCATKGWLRVHRLSRGCGAVGRSLQVIYPVVINNYCNKESVDFINVQQQI